MYIQISKKVDAYINIYKKQVWPTAYDVYKEVKCFCKV